MRKFCDLGLVLDGSRSSKVKGHGANWSFFGKVGRVASEEATLQLIKSKCLPVLVYGLEASSMPIN